MVKLYSDDEMLEKCKLYQPIPLAMEQKVLHYEGNPNNINILNGIIKSPYKTGQPVDSIINYAHQLEQNLPVSADVFISAYEKALNEEIKKGTRQVMDELLEKIEMEGEDFDFQDQVEYAESIGLDKETAEPDRRTKQEKTEARKMGKEDRPPQRYEDLVDKQTAETYRMIERELSEISDM